MKRSLAALLAVCLALTVMLALVSCKNDQSKETAPPYNAKALPNWQSYTIVHQSDASAELSEAFISLAKAIRDKYGFTLQVSDDFVLPGESAPTDTLEILIGNTNRAESLALADNLKASDFMIKFENNRLVIMGGSDETTAQAIAYYIDYLLGEESPMYPSESFFVKGDYRVDKLTLNGIDISNFVIVRGSGMNSEERAISVLVQEAIADACGVTIPFVLASEEETQYEILLGNTGRAETSKPVDAGCVSIEQSESKIALYGNGDYSAAYAIKYFINEVIGAIPKCESYDIKLNSIVNEKFLSPNLTATNLSFELKDYTGAYGVDFMDNENVLARFFESVNEFPDEISTLEPIDASDYILSQKNQVYVAVDGDDQGSGSIDSPLASIDEALVRLKNKNGGIIWVRGGVYEISESIDVSVSANLVAPVFISAYENETPVITGAKSIPTSAFKEINYLSDVTAQRIPASAQSSVVYANLKELGWTDAEIGKIGGADTPRVYIDSIPQSIARYPNEGEPELYFLDVYETGSVTSYDSSNLYDGWIKRVKSGEFNHLSDRFYTDAAGNKNLDYGWAIKMIDLTPCEWVNTGDIWYYGNVFEGWETAHYNIESFDLAKKKMTSKTGSVYGARHSGNSPTGHNDYYLYNAIEMLDAPGEWFYEPETGNFYIYKTEGFESADVRYAASSSAAINVTKSASVVIDGLTIDVAGKGINVTESNNVVIQRCTVKNTLDVGIDILNKSQSCAVIYNDVSKTGDVMINVNPENYHYAKITCDRNIVQNNYLHSPVAEVQGGIKMGGHLSVASHNYLDDCQISFNPSAECIVEYNDIAGGSPDVSDSGLIYLTQYMHHGNHIRYNYLHDWNATGTGLYFDDLSSGNYIYYNIIDTTNSTRDECTKMCYISSGHYNVVYGNICVGRDVDGIVEQASYFEESSWLGYRFKPFTNTLITRFESKYDKAAFYKRFPEYELFMQRMIQHKAERDKAGYVRNELEIYLRAPGNNIIMNNLIIGCKTPVNLVLTTLKNSVTKEYMKTNDLITKNYTSMSPSSVFADYANGDFTILDSALAEIKKEIPDFLPLTTENIGLTYAK